jgi:SagB-type dehydrogenase family enzyme
MSNKFVKLPEPKKKGEVSFEEVIKERRSERSFRDKPLALDQVSQLLWVAQGITDEKGGKRTSPSAGATYPLAIYVVVGNVIGIRSGLYHYILKSHSIDLVFEGDIREQLAIACLEEMFIAEAPICIVICAEYERTTRRYGERGMRYVHIEVGHVGQNIYLQSKSIGLGTVAIGAFYDDEMSRVLKLPERHRPLYLMPIGYV